MRSILGLYIAVLLVTAIPGCSSPQVDPEVAERQRREADRKAIEDLVAREAEAVENGDLELLTRVFADDATLMPPNHISVSGVPSIRAWAESEFDGLAIERYDYRTEELTLAGNWAFERWTVTMTGERGDEQRVSERFKGLHIFHRQQDGTWRIHRDIWNAARQEQEEEEEEEADE